jgi:hypothetical protein
VRNDLIVLVLATVLSYPLGLWLRKPWLLPVLNALPACVVLVHRLPEGASGRRRAGHALVGGDLAIAGTVAFVWWPEPIGRPVIHARHKNEMFEWIRTDAAPRATSVSSSSSTPRTSGVHRGRAGDGSVRAIVLGAAPS